MVLIKRDSISDIKKISFDELLKKFQKCHNLIWEGGKRDPLIAFDEFMKLIMAKIYDEINIAVGMEYNFQLKSNESLKALVDRIKELYNQVRNLNLKAFKEEIDLPDSIIAEIVITIQDICLRDTDADIKGRAFEQFLGKVFRDDYGQYFTPRPIVKFMIQFLDPNNSDILIDPACGSGGFLLYSLIHVTEKLPKNMHFFEKRTNFLNNNLFGIEINDRVARIAMMDLFIHGGSFEAIECNNALLDFSEFDRKRDIKPQKYSIIFTNPPFGAIVRDNAVLKQYELGKNRHNQKTEILFIERCLDLLKSGGRLGIVLPDSVLTNSSLDYVRDFILERTRVLAVISLPQHTFVPSGAGIKSSLLFLEKREDNQRKEENDSGSYQVFMSVAKHIGYDSRGDDDSNNLPEILEDWRNVSNPIIKLARSFLIQEMQIKNNFSADQFVFYSGYENWTKKSLSDICHEIFTGRTPSRKAYTTAGIKILKVRDLTNKGIDWHNNERAFVSHDFFLKFQNMKLQVNDILFISAAHHPKYIGEKIDIIDSIPKRYRNGVLCSAEILVLRVNTEYIDPYYILTFLKTRDGYKAIQSCVRGQTAHIYPKDIKNIIIPIPPQEEFDKIREQIDNLKDSLKKKSEANEKYYFILKCLTDFLDES